MNRADRIYMNKVKGILRECIAVAKKDEDKATDPEDNVYYQGLGEGYRHALELVRTLK